MAQWNTEAMYREEKRKREGSCGAAACCACIGMNREDGKGHASHAIDFNEKKMRTQRSFRCSKTELPSGRTGYFFPTGSPNGDPAFFKDSPLYHRAPACG